MNISRISLEHYRNIALARLEFDVNRPTFLLGSNGQGKSNLLEALSLLTAVRSFRTHELGPLIMNRKRQARVIYEVHPERDSVPVQVELQLSSRTRNVRLDETPVERMADFVGQFPSVVFASDDTQLIKLSPQARRRFFDLLFSVLDREYLRGLQAYHRTLKERNHSLKSGMDRTVVVAFDRILAKWGFFLMTRRREWMQRFAPCFERNYATLADSEAGEVSYRPSLELDSEERYLERLASGFERDRVTGSTQIGPHRDDYSFEVQEFDAKTHGSDGQQRSVALALKLAQIEIIETVLARKPVILLDDILGELDDARKERFWSIFARGCQVFASGTSLPRHPSDLDWQVMHVEAGTFALRD